MTLLETILIEIMTCSTEPERGILKQLRPGTEMGQVAGFAVARLGRLMAAALLPVTINVMTAQTERRFILEQISIAVKTVAVVTGDTVKSGHRLMHNLVFR
jgi:hypothetical protein